MSERSKPHKPVRVAFVDDEPMARSTLRSLLGADSDVEIVAECENGVQAVRAVRELTPDILFLDVQMPGMDGFQVVAELGDELPTDVFVTAFDQYALRAFDVHAVDYLLKPFDDDRFELALGRAKERVRQESVAGMGKQLAEMLASVSAGSSPLSGSEMEPSKARLSIHSEGRVKMVDVDSIIWIESADQYVQIHSLDGVHLMRESMNHLEESLGSERFVRVHRSAIVALDRIRTLESVPSGGARIQLEDETWLPVSRARVAALRGRLRQ